jgi:hypothetical protein
MGTVGIVFAPLAPLVPVAAALVMWISSWVYKYQLMFVFVTRVETGGVSVLIQTYDRLTSEVVSSAYGMWSSTVFSLA